MDISLKKSIGLHVAITLLLILSGLQYFSRKDIKAEPTPITVELMNITDKTNIRSAPKQNSPKKPVKQPETPKPTPPKPAPAKPETKKPEPPKEQPKPEPKPDVKPEVKPEEKKPEKKPDPKKDESAELKELLKTLDNPEDAPAASSEQDGDNQKAITEAEFDPNSPEGMSELDYINNLIMKQIMACWNIPAGAVDAAKLIVDVDIDIAKNGVITFVGISSQGSGAYYQVAADAARRAVLDPRCNPLREIPPLDRYNYWDQKTITFDPSQMIY